MYQLGVYLTKSLLQQTPFLLVFSAPDSCPLSRNSPHYVNQCALIPSKDGAEEGGWAWGVRGGLTGDEMGWLELFARELAAASLERRQGDSVGTLRDFPERLAIFATLEISAARV